MGILLLQFFSFGFRLIPASDDGSLVAVLAPGDHPWRPHRCTAGPGLHHVHPRGAGATLRPRAPCARAGETYVFRRGILRNSSMPVLTLLGLACGELIAGAVVTESVFARPGIGQLTVGAVSTQDLPVLQGVVLVASIAYVTVNLLVDVATRSSTPGCW